MAGQPLKGLQREFKELWYQVKGQNLFGYMLSGNYYPRNCIFNAEGRKRALRVRHGPCIGPLKRTTSFHLHHDCQRWARGETELQLYREQDETAQKLQIQFLSSCSVLLLSFNTSPCATNWGHTRTPGRRDNHLPFWSCSTTGLITYSGDANSGLGHQKVLIVLFISENAQGALSSWAMALLEEREPSEGLETSILPLYS